MFLLRAAVSTECSSIIVKSDAIVYRYSSETLSRLPQRADEYLATGQDSRTCLSVDANGGQGRLSCASSRTSRGAGQCKRPRLLSMLPRSQLHDHATHCRRRCVSANVAQALSPISPSPGVRTILLSFTCASTL